MDGREDTTTLQYKEINPLFPHEITGDQFYAEDQFESYRRLGRDITEKVFGQIIDERGRLIVDRSKNDAYMVAAAKALARLYSPSRSTQV